MNRSDAINIITANLARLGEEELATLAEVTSTLARPETGLELTEAERAAVQRSLDDFKAGRTLSLAEAEARTDAFLAERRAKRSTS